MWLRILTRWRLVYSSIDRCIVHMMNWSYRLDHNYSFRTRCRRWCCSSHFDIHYNCDQWHSVCSDSCQRIDHRSIRRIRFVPYPVDSMNIAHNYHVAKPMDHQSSLANIGHSAIQPCCKHTSSIRRWYDYSYRQRSDQRFHCSHTTDTIAPCLKCRLDLHSNRPSKVHILDLWMWGWRANIMQKVVL